jgi:ABC-2 type transport system permease protein
MTRLAREVGIIARRNLTKLSRSRVMLALSLLQSMLWLVLFPLSFQRLDDLAGFREQGYPNYLAFFAPSALMLTMISVAFQSGFSLVTDIEQGMLDKLLINPIRRGSILIGKVAADAVRMVAQGGVVLMVAVLFGARIRTGVAGALLMLAVAALFGVAWSGLSNFVALRTRNPDTTYLVGAVLTFPMLFLSTAVMPPALLPSTLETISRFNPVTYLVDALRTLMNSGYDWSSVGKALALVLALGGATFAGATRAFGRASR